MPKKKGKNSLKLADFCKKCSKKLKNDETFLKTRSKNDTYDHIDVYCEKHFPR
jgi:hypothetical protein